MNYSKTQHKRWVLDFASLTMYIMKEELTMKKFDTKILKTYVLPVIIGLGTIAMKIGEAKTEQRNIELEKQLDALNKKLNK